MSYERYCSKYGITYVISKFLKIDNWVESKTKRWMEEYIINSDSTYVGEKY